MQLEIGGGNKSLGGEWVNLDQCEAANIRHDLTRTPWPLAGNSVDAVYSSHCLEHLPNIAPALHEISRICRIGATVEIRLPHWLHDCSMCGLGVGYEPHFHSYGPQFWWRICNEHGCWVYWPGCEKRLVHVATHYEPENTIDEARLLFPQMTDEQIMRLIPGTSHEVRYQFEVIAVDDLRSTERAV